MQSLQASKLPPASLLLHSSRLLASGSVTSARIHKVKSDLAALRSSLEAYKQLIYCLLAEHEKELRGCLFAIGSGLYEEAKELDTERKRYMAEMAALEEEWSGLYVQVKGCIQRV